ncbi:TIGR04066 family peptide maturation system protein [Ruminiclostridium cellobioparum]|uniref:TIGR04066 family peptide maturation system protein n=1 Tax=Ruminiclostridium cellobioparum TaxID=29355 RepID=UPI0028ADF8E5|nr:TIGR04066 family peptide maturation system protein [Ruminiclostridium cellobioparum]
MFVKERAIVYPYDVEFSPILRNADILEKYNITGVVSPSGWGLGGKDAGSIDSNRTTGIYISDNFDEQLDKCETVIFTQPYHYIDFTKSIYPKINKAIEAGKNIVCLLKLDEIKKAEIKKKCIEKMVNIIYHSNSYSYKHIERISVENEHIYELSTPVIFVTSIAERAYKFEIQLALREQLTKMGYNVSQVGTRACCEMFGFHSFPEFMYNCSIPESNKVVLFNHFIKKIEETEKPDILVIGIPGGVMPYNKMFTNRFGILAYEVSQAVNPDVAILSTLYDDFKPEYFQRLSLAMKYRLGFEIDCYNLANVQFDWLKAKEEKKPHYTSLGVEHVNKKKKEFSELTTPVYNVLDKNDSYNMAKFIVDKLEGYGQIKCV